MCSSSRIASLALLFFVLACAFAQAQIQPGDLPGDAPREQTWAKPDSAQDSTWRQRDAKGIPDSVWSDAESRWVAADSAHVQLDTAWRDVDSPWSNPDSAWQDTEREWRELEKLNPNDIDFTEVLGDFSRGWFPKPHPATSLSVFGETFNADVYDQGENLRSSVLVPTTAAFGWQNPFDDDEREILKPNSDEEADDSYPESSYTEYGLAYTFNLPLPAVARVAGSFQIIEGMLFGVDTSRSYLALGGSKRSLKEVSVFHLKQYALNIAGGFNIPYYGAFVNTEFATLSSYYYVYIGGSASYTIGSRGTQYQQIATPKSEIRYGNGTDTVTLISRRRFEDVNLLRTAIDVALGWNVAAEFASFSFEAFVSIPQTDIFRDAPWRETYAGFRMSLGYQWLPGD